MPTWGWVTVGVLLVLYGRARRKLGDAAEVGPPSSAEEAAGDMSEGVLGVWGEARDALGAPLKNSLYQESRAGVANGPRTTLAR